VSDGRPPVEPARPKRPLLERVGMAAIALVMAALFGLVGAAAWVSGEVFLGDQAQDIHLIKLENDQITCNGANLLAFDAGIDWDIKREKGWSWKHICEKIGGYSDVLIVGAIMGQMKLTKPQAANAAELFGLSKSETAMLNEVPMRGTGTPMPPTDPLIYRFYEMVMVNGPAWKALIEEEFGDGIMSAIDFDMALERVANPKGDRVKITMSGKFLPYKYYGASGNVPEYGFKEE